MNQSMMPQSTLLTLNHIVTQELRFEVPIYQRLYVWGADQVRTLMDDLLSACERNTPIYYLGGTLVMRRGDGVAEVLELIDGQQRFTTLWLIAQVWGQNGDLRRFLQVTQDGTVRPRLSFAIRDSVNQYFGQGLEDLRYNEEGFHSDAEGLKSILDAQKEIRGYLDDNNYSVTPGQFSRFLLNNVRIVQTEVPANTDLNKLFEVINNRGVQLQHHEILKARMLRVLESAGAADPQLYQSYAWLWDACAGMNGYVERNLARLTNRPVAALFDGEGATGKGEPLASAQRVLAHLNQSTEDKAGAAGAPRLLADILSTPPAVSAESARPGLGEKVGPAGNKPEQAVDEARPVRSIFGFSVLLQHVLRIWLRHEAERCGQTVEDLDRIADKDLLEIFDHRFFKRQPGPDDVKTFIGLLWELRYLFDKFVIKWAMPGDEEVHLIRKLRRNASGNSVSLVRDWEEPESLRAFSLLQSMLYHSQQITTQYWVTPLLAFLHRQKNVSPEACAAFLQHLDNHLLCTSDARPLIERSCDFLGADPWAKGEPHCRLLTDEALGVGFPHYWFYKLEYVLWHRFSHKAGDSAVPPGTAITLEKLKRFRITARNSVEHVFPQTPPATTAITVTGTWRDAFGNLALVSRSLNSEFGNKSFDEKRARFNQLNQDRVDSLKSALIYANTCWSDAEVEAHQNAMIGILDAYLATDWRKAALRP